MLNCGGPEYVRDYKYKPTLSSVTLTPNRMIDCSVRGAFFAVTCGVRP
jgi:hypothetical protein